MSFALRGAPCGDDPRPWAALGRYHDQQSAPVGVAKYQRTYLVARIRVVLGPSSQWRFGRSLGFFKRDAMLGDIPRCFPRLPGVLRHHGTVETGTYPGLTS